MRNLAKKEYKSPKMVAIAVKCEYNLLECSGCNEIDAMESDDEFGFILDPVDDRKA